MKEHHKTSIPFIPEEKDFYDSAHGHNSFDPLGSYTGRTPERDELPVQDADDL